MKGTFVEHYYKRYLRFQEKSRGTECVEFNIPCGKFDFEVIKGRSYTSPDTWSAQADYPEPVIVDEFCDVLGPNEVLYNIGAGFGYYHGVATVAGVPDDSIYCFESDSYYSSILEENIPDNSHNIMAFVGEEKIVGIILYR